VVGIKIVCSEEEHEESEGGSSRHPADRCRLCPTRRPYDRDSVPREMESSNPLCHAFWPNPLGQLARIVPGASKKMLTQNLRKLEAGGIVVRKDLTDLVLHIEYELDERTREGVCALLDHLAKWSGLHLGKSGNDKEQPQ
jgi:DNA-binding HxlR family transcriptional regulator